MGVLLYPDEPFKKSEDENRDGEPLATARAAADGQDVRIGGGRTVVREFLAAGLVEVPPLDPELLPTGRRPLYQWAWSLLPSGS